MSDLTVREERIELPAIPEPVEYLERADEIEAALARIMIVTRSDYERVDGYRKECDVAKKALVEVVFKVAREWADAFHKRITGLQNNTYVAAVDRVRKLAVEKLTAYDREQKRLADLEAARLRAEAEALLRAEREAKAQELDAMGDTEAAVAALDEEIPEVLVEAPKLHGAASGNGYRDNWTAMVVDVRQVPREFMLPDQKALDALAKSSKGKGRVAGVKFVNNPTFVGRSK